MQIQFRHLLLKDMGQLFGALKVELSGPCLSHGQSFYIINLLLSFFSKYEIKSSSMADRYRWAKIRIPEFRGGDKWSSYLVQFSLPAETRGQLSTLCTLFEGRFGRQEPPATTRSNMRTIIRRVDEPLPEFTERTLQILDTDA